jgi:hypothetical protein
MTPQPDLSKWLSKFDAARLLGIGESTLDRRIKRTGSPEVRMRPRGNGLKPEPMCNPDDVARMMEESKRAVVMPPETAVQLRQPVYPADRALEVMDHIAQIGRAPENPALWLSLKAASAYSGLSMALLQRLASSGVGVVAVKDNGWKFQRASLDELGEGLVGFLESEKA